MDNPEKLAALRTQYEDKQNKIITQYDHYNLCPNDIHVYAWSSCLSLSTFNCKIFLVLHQYVDRGKHICIAI